jgi:hypothetical protein
MTLEEKIDYIESDDRSHRARLLLLLLAYSDAQVDTSLNLIKLAYFDYFLRYPASLERVLKSRGKSASKLHIQESERDSIDANFGALRVEPWDAEYRRWIAAEFATDRVFARLGSDGEFSIALTKDGLGAARALKKSPLFTLTYNRALIIAKNLDVQKVSTLRRAISKALPETVSLQQPVAI